MTLKERLDAVWNDKRVACACHIVIWTENKHWFTRFADYGLYFKKGRRVRLKLISRVAAIRKHQRLA